MFRNIKQMMIIFADPEPITMIRAIEINDTKVTLAWDLPQGEYDAFQVNYINADGNFVQNITNTNQITIYDLKPHRNYTFTLVVRSGTESFYLRRSHPISASFTTSESYPGKVSKFEPTDIQPSEISFKWSLPDQEQNGIIRKFSITYGLEVIMKFNLQLLKIKKINCLKSDCLNFIIFNCRDQIIHRKEISSRTNSRA